MLRIVSAKQAWDVVFYLRTEEDGTVNADIYVSLQYGVNVPAVSIEIQKAVKAAVYDMAEVAISEVNVHVESIVTEKSQKPDLAGCLTRIF